MLDDSFLDSPETAGNFPLGIVDDSTYQHFKLDIRADDWLLLYTDALIEAANASDQQLGESGLKEIVCALDINATPRELGLELLRKVVGYSAKLDADDATIIALKFGSAFRRPGIVEKFRAYWKLVFGG